MAHAIKSFIPLGIRRRVCNAGPYRGGKNSAGRCPLGQALYVVGERGSATPSAAEFSRRWAKLFNLLPDKQAALNSAAADFIRLNDTPGEYLAFNVRKALRIAKKGATPTAAASGA